MRNVETKTMKVFRNRVGFSMIELLLAIIILAIGMSMLASIWPAAARDAIGNYDTSLSAIIAKSGIQMTWASNNRFFYSTNSTVVARSLTDANRMLSDDPGSWNRDSYSDHPSYQEGANYDWVNWAVSRCGGLSQYGAVYMYFPNTPFWIQKEVDSGTGLYLDSRNLQAGGTLAGGQTTLYRLGTLNFTEAVPYADCYHTQFIPLWQQEYPQQSEPDSPKYPYYNRSNLGFCAVARCSFTSGTSMYMTHVVTVPYKKTALDKKVILRRIGGADTTNWYYAQGTFDLTRPVTGLPSGDPRRDPYQTTHPNGDTHKKRDGILTWLTTKKVRWDNYSSGSAEDGSHIGKGYGYFRVGGYIINGDNASNAENMKYRKIISVENNGRTCTLEKAVTTTANWRMVFVVHEVGSLPTAASVVIGTPQEGQR